MSKTSEEITKEIAEARREQILNDPKAAYRIGFNAGFMVAVTDIVKILSESDTWKDLPEGSTESSEEVVHRLLNRLESDE